jgi:hypothetical protein
MRMKAFGHPFLRLAYEATPTKMNAMKVIAGIIRFSENLPGFHARLSFSMRCSRPLHHLWME